MKLPHTVSYAIRAACYLAQTDLETPIPCSEMAREGRMPDRFLLQVLRKLVKQELLESTCGVSGGYVLSRPPEKVTLQDIVDTFDDALEIQLPALECATPAIEAGLSDVLARISKVARRELRRVTLAELVAAIPRDHYSLRIRQARIAHGNITPVGARAEVVRDGASVTR